MSPPTKPTTQQHNHCYHHPYHHCHQIHHCLDTTKTTSYIDLMDQHTTMKVIFIHWLQQLHIRTVRVLRCCSAAFGASQSVRLQHFRLKTHSCLKTHATFKLGANTKHSCLKIHSCLKTQATCTTCAHINYFHAGSAHSHPRSKHTHVSKLLKARI